MGVGERSGEGREVNRAIVSRCPSGNYRTDLGAVPHDGVRKLEIFF